jgi:hypothetical protein
MTLSVGVRGPRVIPQTSHFCRHLAVSWRRSDRSLQTIVLTREPPATYGTIDAHRAAAPTPTQMQRGPHESSVQFPVGHPSTETQPVLAPPGLTQVQPDPQVPRSQDSRPEQVPTARQRRLSPPLLRHSQPGPQGLDREHSPLGRSAALPPAPARLSVRSARPDNSRPDTACCSAFCPCTGRACASCRANSASWRSCQQFHVDRALRPGAYRTPRAGSAHE